MKKVILTLLLGVTTLSAFTQVPSNVPTNGLVGYWPFNGNANDESGNGNNGTVNGATLTIDRNGLANKAYGFDGSDWIEVMNSTSIQPSTAFSISAWVFVESSQPSLGGNYTRIINKNHSEAQNFATYQLITGLNTGYGKAGVCIRTGSGISGGAAGIYTWTGATNNVIGQYQLIVGTYNGSELKIYQNGTLSSSVNHTGNLFYDSGNLWFGRGKSGSAPGTDMFFNGKIDDVGMWNRALTQTEITDLYNGCSTPTATITPQSTLTFCQGASVVLNASIGAGYTYEWYKNGNIINGSITSSYTANQSGSYTVKVINGSCNATSSATTVTVNPNPTAAINAAGVSTFCQGGSVVLNASTGSGYTYEWYKNGNIINGSTTSSYTANQSGSYTVKVINGSCNATSSATIVTVNPNPTVSLSLANFIHIKESPVTLAGSPSGGTYSGAGVVGSTFSSTNAGLGKKTITYNYTTGAGCSGSATAITTVYDTTACSTFDTLFINIAVAGLTAPNNLGTLKIWPNPANDHITIDNGNYVILSGYSVKIETVLGQEVFKSAINQQQFSVDLTTWNGKGIYLVHVLDNQNNIIETKKIVLQ